MSQGAVLPVVVNVTNTGTVAGDEIVMVFVSFPNTHGAPARQGAEGLRARQPRGGRGEAGDRSRCGCPTSITSRPIRRPAPPGHWVVETGPINIMVTDGSQLRRNLRLPTAQR